MAENGSSPHVLIVGGGAAGMSCALYLARAGLTATVFDRGTSTLRRAELHNFPGIGATPGFDWLGQVRAAVEGRSEIAIVDGKVSGVDRDDDGFKLDVDGQTHRGDFIVLCTGQGPFDYAEALGVQIEDPVQPYVKTNIVIDKWGETSVKNAFSCGVLAGWPSQTIICAGTGATVAVRIASRVKGEFWVDHDTLPAGQ